MSSSSISARNCLASGRDCAVCMDQLPDRYYGTTCRHPVCRDCIVRSRTTECPLCRTPILLTRSETTRHNAIWGQEQRREAAAEEMENARVATALSMGGAVEDMLYIMSRMMFYAPSMRFSFPMDLDSDSDSDNDSMSPLDEDDDESE